MTKPTIWIVDTTILCNILNIPGKNQHLEEILTEFDLHIEDQNSHMLPFTSVLETGNHIGQLGNSGLRRKIANSFSKLVTQSISGETPWKPLNFPDAESMMSYLIDFPQKAEYMGLGDHLIIKHWEETCAKLPAYQVKIWTKDSHLAGYECNP